MKQIDNDTISIEWEVRDVLERRPDLTKKQARAVLDWLLRNHDAEIGINWDQIDYVCDLLFPDNKN